MSVFLPCKKPNVQIGCRKCAAAFLLNGQNTRAHRHLQQLARKMLRDAGQRLFLIGIVFRLVHTSHQTAHRFSAQGGAGDHAVIKIVAACQPIGAANRFFPFHGPSSLRSAFSRRPPGYGHRIVRLANFLLYKKPLLSGPSAKIIRPAVSSVKKFRHFRRFRKRFRYRSLPSPHERCKSFPASKKFTSANLSVSA